MSAARWASMGVVVLCVVTSSSAWAQPVTSTISLAGFMPRTPADGVAAPETPVCTPRVVVGDRTGAGDARPAALSFPFAGDDADRCAWTVEGLPAEVIGAAGAEGETGAIEGRGPATLTLDSGAVCARLGARDLPAAFVVTSGGLAVKVVLAVQCAPALER